MLRLRAGDHQLHLDIGHSRRPISNLRGFAFFQVDTPSVGTAPYIFAFALSVVMADSLCSRP